MKIRIDKLYEGEHQIAEHLEPNALELDEEHFVDPIDVTATWDRRGQHACIQFQISTYRCSMCDRCLEDVRLKIDTKLGIVIRFSDVVSEESDDPEYRVVSLSDVEIDFTADIRDAILLAIPFKILCREDCRGLCPQCGRDLNHETCDCKVELPNPEWAALMTLKKRG